MIIHFTEKEWERFKEIQNSSLNSNKFAEIEKIIGLNMR